MHQLIGPTIRFFNRPHPFIFNKGSLLVPFVVTLLVLLLFRPFGFSEFEAGPLLGWSLFFAGVAAGCVYAVVRLLQRLFPQQMETGNWTIGKEVLLILSVLFCISLVIFLLFLLLARDTAVGQLFQTVVIQTVLISIFPVLTLLLYEQYTHQKVKRQEAQALNARLLQQQAGLQSGGSAELSPKINLLEENQKVALRIQPAQLLFVKSEGNYVEVFYRQGQKTERKLLRNSLKAMTEQLSLPHFFRCHKSYLVNLQHLQEVTGNARNLELTIEQVQEKIPVSRSKSATLLQTLQDLEQDRLPIPPK
ncbi:MAG: LytTR family transcriptional regulator [Phaeodactylibacter sp.]|nr:LytTR family transcriptional regulator [Phaeodactylibacter sp.]